MKDALTFVHSVLKEILTKDDVTIDATCGNGHDTLFLAKESKFVYGFDIQEQAIRNTSKLLKDNKLDNYQLFLDSHRNIANYLHTEVKAVTFNLGYLPGSDKTVITNKKETLIALDTIKDLLCVNGIISLIVYTGHPGGIDESNALLSYVETLPKNRFQIIKYTFLNRSKAPYVLLIEKTK